MRTGAAGSVGGRPAERQRARAAPAPVCPGDECTAVVGDPIHHLVEARLPARTELARWKLPELSWTSLDEQAVVQLFGCLRCLISQINADLKVIADDYERASTAAPAAGLARPASSV